MKHWWTILPIILVVALPLAFQHRSEVMPHIDETLIVISPHDEWIRIEFEEGFRRWHFSKTGRTADIDWRAIGGTSEIIRYVQSTFLQRFRNHWENELRRSWDPEVQNAFMNRRLRLPGNPQQDTPELAARRAFLESDVGCGIDVIFGGGSFDFIQLAQSGLLVPFTDPATIEEQFPEHLVPQSYGGEPFYDTEARWVGAVLSQFGIIANTDALLNLGITDVPKDWRDLADPRLVGQVALADPTQSASSTKAFEMIIQQQMQHTVRESSNPVNPGQETLAEGWMRGMRMVQLICANARYFTDSSKKPSIDVAAGECAAGMSIDFYGRFQQESLVTRANSQRFEYHTPQGGTTVSVDPIALFRGAQNPDLARSFIGFVMSESGQRLWNQIPGTPGGPQRFALRRTPVIRSLYQPQWDRLRSDPGVDPYLESADFYYEAAWTSSRFSPLRFIVRTAFVEPHRELQLAWRAIGQAREEGRLADAQAAMDHLQDLSIIDYAQSGHSIPETLNLRTKITEVRLARELTTHFLERYRTARAIADGTCAPQK